MPTPIIAKFDGGHAEDIRTFSIDECEKSLNFDLSSLPHLLQTIPATEAETMAAGGAITDYKLSDVTKDVYSYGSDAYIALGQAGASDTNMKFFSKSNLSDGWTLRAERTSGSVITNTLVGYKGLAYACEAAGSDVQLIELTNTTTVTSKGTVTGQSTACKPYVHPEDNILYGGCGNVIWKWDGTTFTSSSTIIPTSMTITSLTSYGTYLVIACRPTSGGGDGKAIAYLWGRDMTINTLQGIIDFGRGNLNIIENLGDIIVGVVTLNNSQDTINNRFQVKVWAGGEVTLIKDLKVDSTVGLTSSIFKAKSKDKLYFLLSSDDCVWVVGKNKGGSWFVAKERYIENSSTPSSIRGFSLIGDIAWFGYISGGSSLFYKTKFATNSPSSDYTNTSVYKTTINPAMNIEDRYKNKQLDAIQISWTGASSGTVAVKYSVDGSAFTTIISESNSDAELVKEASNESDGIPFKSGREFQFQIEASGKTKIKEIRYKYTVLETTI